MKNKLLILLFTVLVSLSSLKGQDIKQDGTVIVLPRVVVEKMFADANEKKNLEYVLSKRDSTVAIYEIELESRSKKIKELILTVDEYKVLVRKLEEYNTLTEAEKQALKRENRKLRFKNTIANIVMVVEVVVIIILAI